MTAARAQRARHISAAADDSSHALADASRGARLLAHACYLASLGVPPPPRVTVEATPHVDTRAATRVRPGIPGATAYAHRYPAGGQVAGPPTRCRDRAHQPHHTCLSPSSPGTPGRPPSTPPGYGHGSGVAMPMRYGGAGMGVPHRVDDDYIYVIILLYAYAIVYQCIHRRRRMNAAGLPLPPVAFDRSGTAGPCVHRSAAHFWPASRPQTTLTPHTNGIRRD